MSTQRVIDSRLMFKLFLVGKRAVPGTPWCIVWTGDGKHFFFNPSAKLSLWEIPEELRHRGDVAGLIESGPERKDDPPPQPEPTVVEVTYFFFIFMTNFMINGLFSKKQLNLNLLLKISHHQQRNQKLVSQIPNNFAKSANKEPNS